MAQMVRLNPHIAIPGLIVPNVQEVPFSRYIGHRTNLGNLAVEQAYITMINNINSETAVGQQWGNDLNKQSYTMGQISAPYYRIESYVEYNVDEQAKFEALSNGIALPDFLENLAKQAINQRRHQALLFGFDTETGLYQGILANATQKTLPPDSNNKSTLLEYDVAQLNSFLGSLARTVMDTTYGMAKPTVIASSSRVINYIRSAIIPLTESQKDGAGIDSVGGVLGRVMSEWLGVGKVEFISDNLLQDDTNGDTIVFLATGIDDQDGVTEEDSQNLVGKFNSIKYNTWYDSAEGLMKFEAPPTLGTYAMKYTFKMTPGVTLRSECAIKCKIQYS